LANDEIDAIGILGQDLDDVQGNSKAEFGEPVEVSRQSFLSSAESLAKFFASPENVPVRYCLEYELYPGYFETEADSASGLLVGGKAANIEAGTTCKLFVAVSINAKGRATWDEGTDISDRQSIVTDTGKEIRITRKPVPPVRLLKFLKSFCDQIRDNDELHVSMMIG